jgi:hypothetical protein
MHCANRERAQSGDLLPLTSDAAVWDSAARRPLSRTSGSLGEARRRARDNCFQPNSATRSDQSGSPITVRSDASLAAWPCRNQRWAFATRS